jgi:hypothetical protein
MTQIEVCERLLDRGEVIVDVNGRAELRKVPKYHAQIKGGGGWACGLSIDEAIGHLVKCHQEKFGIKIEYLEGKLAR